jgi:hypothetical protein
LFLPLKIVAISVIILPNTLPSASTIIQSLWTSALFAFDEQFRVILKPYGLLTRDARKVERKKYGRRITLNSHKWQIKLMSKEIG